MILRYDDVGDGAAWTGRYTYSDAIHSYINYHLGLHLASMVHEYVVTQDPSVMVCVSANFDWVCQLSYVLGSNMGNSRSTGHDDKLHRKTWLFGRFKPVTFA